MKHKQLFIYLKYIIIFIAISFIPVTSVPLAKEISPCFSTLWPHEKSDLSPDPALIFGKLPNGFRYVLMENKEPRDRVSLRLNVQAGSLNETDDQQGLAHYLEHMMFNGSENFPPGELVKYFQSIGMAFGSDANAHTGFSETVYDVLLPTGDRKSLEEGILVIQDYAKGALLMESEVERERGIILAEKRTRDSVSYRTYVASMKFLFAGSQITERMPIGTEAVIRKADQARLKAYYDAWYRPENMVVVMVGDFDIKVAEPLIKSAFGKFSARTPARPCPETGVIKHEGIRSFYHFEKEAGNTKTSLQAVWNREPEPDSPDYQKNMIMQYLGNSILDNRLEAMIENPNNPFTSVSIYSGIFLNRIGYAKLSARSAPENWKKVLTLLENSLRQALEFGFTPSELDRVKKEFIAELDAAVLKKDTRDSEGLSDLIIDNLNDDKVLMSPEQEKELYAGFVESLTTGKVDEAFAGVWNKDHRLILVTGNASVSEKDKSPEDVILAVFEESAKKGVTKPAEDKAIKFPYLAEPETAGAVKGRTEIPDLGIEQIDFENGVRLNLKKTDFKKNEVTAAVSFGPGRKAEPAPGLAMFATSLVNRSGLGRLTENELDRALAGKNTSVRFGVKENCFLLKGSSVSPEIPLLFQLLYAHITDPGYREDAYNLVRRQFGQMYDKLSHTIEGAMQLSGERFLAGGDSRFGIASREATGKLALEQVRDWTDPSENPGLEISVVGDFDPEIVKDLAARYFGTLPLRKKVEEKEESLEFPVGESLTTEVETDVDKGMVIMAWPTEDYSDISRVRRLSVLANVIDERLREEIREKLGATYSQYAYNNSSRTYAGYGVLRCVLYVDPGMSEKIIKKVRRIASELAEKGPTEDELRRALDPVLTSIKDMMRTNRYWLSTVLKGSARYPKQIEWCRTIQEDYASVTVQDIALLAKTYLDKNKAAEIVIKPVPKKE
ncbi:insulinase family protein [Desulfococcaceae bacterium HSG8]|nr:insulinase family protein [Desulfococcaceae bacterium HSG8]